MMRQKLLNLDGEDCRSFAIFTYYLPSTALNETSVLIGWMNVEVGASSFYHEAVQVPQTRKKDNENELFQIMINKTLCFHWMFLLPLPDSKELLIRSRSIPIWAMSLSVASPMPQPRGEDDARRLLLQSSTGTFGTDQAVCRSVYYMRQYNLLCIFSALRGQTGHPSFLYR